jgi:hypothetical protein
MAKDSLWKESKFMTRMEKTGRQPGFDEDNDEEDAFSDSEKEAFRPKAGSLLPPQFDGLRSTFNPHK